MSGFASLQRRASHDSRARRSWKPCHRDLAVLRNGVGASVSSPAATRSLRSRASTVGSTLTPLPWARTTNTRRPPSALPCNEKPSGWKNWPRIVTSYTTRLRRDRSRRGSMRGGRSPLALTQAPSDTHQAGSAKLPKVRLAGHQGLRNRFGRLGRDRPRLDQSPSRTTCRVKDRLDGGRAGT